ncbi:MAG TPA: hypothetical protein DDX19_10475 [Rhodopirellula baltica]|uniref:Uncharacterized protein n=1 Tax=Rhodopirellula baltica (strain DSM 10527 / NCIMB 13988 / SH1) TaxID=243090 RepID=Q7UGV4_RHOBA|nr:hypothetical protein [Rhodopirellula baltica]CAD78225.1 hypothetical protein-signal peptide prediction [Rhodopirellula baltica SH 1]HBE63144.1 hypothetical protein [Rhodopirellula baltica]
MTIRSFILTFAALSLMGSSSVHAEGRTIARLFWQDHHNATLKWADLQKSKDGYSLSEKDVNGFPDLDTDDQTLVQMQVDDGLLVVGVRDEANGDIGSGWVAVETGATQEEHGDHFHWRFLEAPSVHSKVINSGQGNPAHLYRYGTSFVMANDQRNGFTVLDSKSVRDAKSPTEAGRFYEGGGGHITLAVAEGKVAYSTWIDREGENAGRVDVVGLAENADKGYRIASPTGILHGATYCGDKVFFAPSDGVCWVRADLDVDDAADSITVNHLEIGTDSDGKPLRTGAFATIDHAVVFSSGKAEQSKLCFIDASCDTLKVQSLSMELASDQSLKTPIVGKGSGGRPIALCFAESKEAPESDQLYVVDLDPDGNGDYSDAKARAPIAVGPSQIEGHFGHHDAVFLPRGRQIAVTNPGDASIWVISLSDQSVEAKFECEGMPTSLVSISD